MKLSAPKQIVWLIALILGLLSILMALGVFTISALAGHVFWIMAAAWALLILATLLKGI